MGFFSDLVTSPRQKAAKGMYDTGMNDVNAMLGDIAALKPKTSGITTASGVRSAFELPGMSHAGYDQNVERAYMPSRAGIASRFARMRGAAGNKMGGSNATPGAEFGSLYGAEADAFSQLESGIGAEKMKFYDRDAADRRSVAAILQSLMQEDNSAENTFSVNRLNLKNSALATKQNAMASYINSLSDSSPLDDIMSGGLMAAQAAGALGWNPFKAKVKPGGGAQYAGSAMFLPPE